MVRFAKGQVKEDVARPSMYAAERDGRSGVVMLGVAQEKAFRLRRKGLIRPIPRSQRYELTAFGRRTAVFFTTTHVRTVNPSLAELDPHLPQEIADHHTLSRAWRAYEHALDDKIKRPLSQPERMTAP